MSGGPGRWWDRVLYVAVFVLATTLAVARSTETGIARDEVVYMDHGSRYATWWRTLLGDGDGLSERAITATFGGKGATDGNREHPPLMKTLFGLSEHVVHDRLGWADEVTAYRLPSALANALLVVLVMAWTRRLWGRAEAVVAAGCALFLPRALFHAELACFDAAIAALWFATVYAVWRGQASRRWAVLAGVMFGLALATKHNALILPAPLMLHAAVLAYRRQRSRVDAATAAAAGRPAPARLLVRAGASLAAIGRGAWQAKPWPLVAMAGLGPLVLIALWPWLWFDTVAHLSDWIGFHLHHVHYNFEYLGDNWNAPPFPWHVALVTTALTVPVVTLVAAGLGAAVWLARWRRGASPDPAHGAGLLLLLSAAAAMGPFFLGSTPIFGAEKHWAPAIPSLCVVAGVGAVWAARRAAAAMRASWAWAAAPMRARRLEHAVVAAVASLVVERGRDRDPARAPVRPDPLQRTRRRRPGWGRPRHEPSVLGLRGARRVAVPAQPCSRPRSAGRAGVQPRRLAGLGPLPGGRPHPAFAPRRRQRVRRRHRAQPVGAGRARAPLRAPRLPGVEGVRDGRPGVRAAGRRRADRVAVSSPASPGPRSRPRVRPGPSGALSYQKRNERAKRTLSCARSNRVSLVPIWSEPCHNAPGSVVQVRRAASQRMSFWPSKRRARPSSAGNVNS